MVAQIKTLAVKLLVQWSLTHCSDRLSVNDSYPRTGAPWDLLNKGRYLLDVLNGTDISVLVVNMTVDNSFIIDGAARVNTLFNFQQGKIPMVVTHQEMPDKINFRPYGICLDEDVDAYKYESETLVEAFYTDLPADQKRSFLNTQLDIIMLNGFSLDEEVRIYYECNNICPSSPVYQSDYSDNTVLKDMRACMSTTRAMHIERVLEMIGGQHAALARAEVLRFTRDLVRHCPLIQDEQARTSDDM
jgi:hypothetical protein